QVARPLGRKRDVAALVLAENLEDHRIVVAEGARVELHDEAILDAHARELDEHVRRELLLILGGRVPSYRARPEALELGLRELEGQRRRHAVIGRGRAERSEDGAPRLDRAQKASVALDVLAGELAEPRQLAPPFGRRDLEELIRPEGRPDDS